MKCSIIIATYNRNELLLKTLIKITELKVDFNYEVIIVENSLNRNPTIEKISEKNNFQYYNYIEKGATNARHFGVRKAKGEFLVIIDDDIEFDENYLYEILKPFENKKIHQVAGRVILNYEIVPDKFVKKYFENYLSKFDLGNNAKILNANYSAISCNMAIRKKTFIEVGGLNVCYYGDEEKLYMSGDGECGLSKKLHDRNYKIYYAPNALVKHWVPKERITINYFKRRSRNSAIETLYRDYRYKTKYFHLIVPKRIFFSFISIFLSFNKDLLAFKIEFFKTLIKQYFRIIKSSKLRSHIVKTSYY